MISRDPIAIGSKVDALDWTTDEAQIIGQQILGEEDNEIPPGSSSTKALGRKGEMD